MTAVGTAGFVLTFLLPKGLDGARMVNHPSREQPPNCQIAGCGGGGREPSGAARPGPACRAVEAEGMAPAAPDGEGRGGNAGPEVARGGCGAGVCPSARTPGKGTVSAGIGGKVCVDPAEGERRPQPGYRLDCAIPIAFLHPCFPLEDIR